MDGWREQGIKGRRKVGLEGELEGVLKIWRNDRTIFFEKPVISECINMRKGLRYIFLPS